MELTRHATERIFGRTKMHPDDVLSIIASGAAVELGRTENEALHLFFSPFDHATKIAVVSQDGYIITIWHKDYLLPAFAAQVTPALEQEARAKLKQYLFGRVQNGAPDKAVPEMVPVTIEVQVKGRKVYERVGGSIDVKVARTLENLLAAVTAELDQIASVVAEHYGSSIADVNYRVFVTTMRSYGPRTSAHTIRHSKYVSRSNRAA